jgi:hypothetical protein
VVAQNGPLSFCFESSGRTRTFSRYFGLDIECVTLCSARSVLSGRAFVVVRCRGLHRDQLRRGDLAVLPLRPCHRAQARRKQQRLHLEVVQSAAAAWLSRVLPRHRWPGVGVGVGRLDDRPGTGGKRLYFAPFYTKTDHFTKTGSGQT